MSKHDSVMFFSGWYLGLGPEKGHWFGVQREKLCAHRMSYCRFYSLEFSFPMLVWMCETIDPQPNLIFLLSHLPNFPFTSRIHQIQVFMLVISSLTANDFCFCLPLIRFPAGHIRCQQHKFREQPKLRARKFHSLVIKMGWKGTVVFLVKSACDLLISVLVGSV